MWLIAIICFQKAGSGTPLQRFISFVLCCVSTASLTWYEVSLLRPLTGTYLRTSSTDVHNLVCSPESGMYVLKAFTTKLEFNDAAILLLLLFKCL